ncbi:MAG: 16S rRNA (adenine(1518)-N(6)/adenine(1519)-N(6))-dimethyltransferase, partial [Clostridia bacterium]|nr:16S rRNA (adenine(1518)-N(6)/adenine(1519)-N(6))-dimethyltransferase [Clostridia bacterium]
MERPLKYILAKHGLTLKKAFGQNFLTDETLLSEIVEKAGITKDDTVVEIGCGAGALTEKLAEKAARVFGYEIDERLKPVLNETLADFDNVKIIFKDVLKEKIP